MIQADNCRGACVEPLSKIRCRHPHPPTPYALKQHLQKALELGKPLGGKTPRQRFPARDLQRGKQLQRAAPPVPIAHPQRASALRRADSALQLARLDGSLLVHAHHQMSHARQGLRAFVQAQDRQRPFQKAWVW